MKIETSLDLENRTATVTIYTNEKAFRMTYKLDEIAKTLDSVTSNPVLEKITKMIGLQIEVVKKEEPKPSAEKFR